MNKAESTANYLCKISNTINIPNQVGAILKSHYLTISRVISIKRFGVPQKEFGPEKICQHCSIPWQSGSYEAKIKASKKQKKSIRRKLRKTIEKCKSTDVVKKAKETLNCNVLNVKCFNCHKINHINVKKPQKKLIIPNKIPFQPTVTEHKVKLKGSPKLHEVNKIKQSVYADLKKVATSTPTPVKVKTKPKSNKKKDKFAGLCKVACMAASKQREAESEVQKNTNSIEQHEERLKMFLKPAN